MHPIPSRTAHATGWCLALLTTAALTACGGGDAASTSVTSAATASTDTSTDAASTEVGAASVDVAAADVASSELQPVYHVAPITPDAPDGTDADGREASAFAAPKAIAISSAAASLATARAVPDDMRQTLSSLAGAGRVTAQSSAVRAEGTTSTTVTVYTPAQMRAAYGLSRLPAATTLNKGAFQGSGQTIYIVDAYHNPNIANDLAVFSQTFGLPTCSTLTIAATTALPLAAPAAGSGCSFGVVYAAKGSTTAAPTGALTATAPAINRTWTAEISLDVEWAHAMAPAARIVLIEAQSASVPDLMAAVALANRMGPGIVSMSFGTAEFAYTSMLFWGTPFAASNMTYVAAAGDGGSQSNWPSVDARVLSVGGTSLSWNGTTRAETAWASTGGAISKQVPVPTYQASIRKPGDPTATGATKYRGSADVSFNANPYTGQYTYVTPSSTTGGTGWISTGGTSISAPQWAGLLAVTNASRSLVGKSVLAQPHTLLYANVYGISANYLSSALDVISGSNGTCGAMCTTATGYDLPTGIGSPKADSLVTLLSAL